MSQIYGLRYEYFPRLPGFMQRAIDSNYMLFFESFGIESARRYLSVMALTPLLLILYITLMTFRSKISGLNLLNRIFRERMLIWLFLIPFIFAISSIPIITENNFFSFYAIYLGRGDVNIAFTYYLMIYAPFLASTLALTLVLIRALFTDPDKL